VRGGRVFEAKFVGILTFTAVTPIHVGGRREGNVLYALRLRSSGRLLILASTWKGALRSLAERLAPTLQMEPLERLALERVTLSQRPEDSVKDLLGDFERALRGEDAGHFRSEDVRRVLEEIGYDLGRVEDARLALIEYLSYYCPVGRLFGNSVWAASVRFLDTLLPPAVQSRYGVGIGRRTGTVEEHVLYRVETTGARIEVPLVVVGEVEARGSTPSRLLASTLEAVRELGLSVGGRRSAGLGLLQLTGARFHVVELGRGGDERGALLANPLEAPAMDLGEFARWLRG